MAEREHAGHNQPAPRRSLFAVWKWPWWIWVIAALIFPLVWFSMLKIYLQQVTEERQRQAHAEQAKVREHLHRLGVSLHNSAATFEQPDPPADALHVQSGAN